jgi:hypothetical protein
VKVSILSPDAKLTDRIEVNEELLEKIFQNIEMLPEKENKKPREKRK